MTSARSPRLGTNLRFGLYPIPSVWSQRMETIEISRADGVVNICISQPGKKNAALPQTWRDLHAALVDIGRRVDDRVVVLTGAGDDFCSGADLWIPPTGEMPPHYLSAMRQVGDAALALHRLPQPTIAKVRGVAVGAGCNLAFGCDLVVSSETARFSQIFSRRGLSLDFGGSWLVPRRVGLHRAKELAFFGDILSAAEASEMGLVNRVVPDAELDEFVLGWAQRLVAAPPIALAQSKRMLNNSMNMTMEQALDDESAAQSVNFATRDTTEAITAFVEKRSPVFKGR
jgi:enoyl-CoA hydratase/carnithine racemase